MLRRVRRLYCTLHPPIPPHSGAPVAPATVAPGAEPDSIPTLPEVGFGVVGMPGSSFFRRSSNNIHMQSLCSQPCEGCTTECSNLRPDTAGNQAADSTNPQSGSNTDETPSQGTKLGINRLGEATCTASTSSTSHVDREVPSTQATSSSSTHEEEEEPHLHHTFHEDHPNSPIEDGYELSAFLAVAGFLGLAYATVTYPKGKQVSWVQLEQLIAEGKVARITVYKRHFQIHTVSGEPMYFYAGWTTATLRRLHSGNDDGSSSDAHFHRKLSQLVLQHREQHPELKPVKLVNRAYLWSRILA